MKKYMVQETLKEVVEIEVEAISEDEAIEAANGIDQDEWSLVSSKLLDSQVREIN